MIRASSALALLLSATPALAEFAFSQAIDHEKVSTDDTFQLTILVIDGPEDAQIDYPPYADLEVVSKTQSTQLTYAKGADAGAIVRRVQKYNLVMRATRAGKITVRPAVLRTASGTFQTEALELAFGEGPPEAASATPQTAAGEAPGPSKHRLAVSVGFSHWFGRTLGNPDGYTTPSICIGVRPGLGFLELRARYAITVVPLTLQSGVQTRAGFASLEVTINRELRIGGTSLAVFAGPLGVLFHSDGGVAPGFGVVAGVEYLFITGLPHGNSVGVVLGIRGVYYHLPGEHLNLLTEARRDAQVDLGLIGTLF